MKLKLVVAMSVLGFISAPAFADAAMQTNTTTTTTTSAKHHRHHHKVKHHMVAAQSYKGEDLKGEMAPVVEACPINNWYTSMLDSASQNVGRAKPTVGCYNPISFAGGIATDLQTFSLNKGYAGENTERLSLNDAYLNVFGNVNQYVKAFGSLSYNNTSKSGTGTTNTSPNGVRLHSLAGAYDNNLSNNALQLEQGYITFSDLENMPVYFQVGKQFQDYGRYTIHPLQRSMTQVLTETLRTSANLGFVTHMGVHGSVGMFDDRAEKNTDTHSHYAYSAELGWDQPSDSLGWDAGIGYLSSMTATGGVNSALTTANNYVHRVGAAEIHGDVNSGPFSFGARYTTALQSFNSADIATSAVAGSGGAKPWAYDLKAGYGFTAFNKNQNVYVGYQHSGQAALIPLPQGRWTVGYGIDVLQNTMISAEYGHDNAYSAATSGGSGSSSNTLGVRAAVKFG